MEPQMHEAVTAFTAIYSLDTRDSTVMYVKSQ